jgi:hypothetical protein
MAVWLGMARRRVLRARGVPVLVVRPRPACWVRPACLLVRLGLTMLLLLLLLLLLMLLVLLLVLLLRRGVGGGRGRRGGCGVGVGRVAAPAPAAAAVGGWHRLVLIHKPGVVCIPVVRLMVVVLHCCRRGVTRVRHR